MEWSQELCLEVIHKYKNMEVLWNPRHPSYYHKLKKEDTWTELATSVNKNADEIKKKMDSLKGSYRREKTRVKKSLGTGKARSAIYESKWFAYEAFQFLDDKDDPGKTINNVDYPSSDNEDLMSCEEQQLSQTQPSKDANVSQSAEVGQSEPQPKESTASRKLFHTPPKRHPVKRKMASEDAKLDEAFTYLRQAANVAKKPKDRCSLFGEFIAEKLRSFDKRRIAIAEHKINSVLFELEMSSYEDRGTLNYSSQTIPFSRHQPSTQSFTQIQYSQSPTPTQYSQTSTPIASPYVSPQDSSSTIGEYLSHFTDSASTNC